MSKLLVKDKTMQNLVRRQVSESLREILSDPDFGLDLADTASKRLAKSTNSYKQGSYKSFGEILKKYQ